MNLRKRFDLLRRVVNLTMQLDGKTQELLAAHRRIRVLEQERDQDVDRTTERDLIAAQARIADLTDDLAQSRRQTRDAEVKHKEAHDRVLGLERQLDEYARSHASKARIADQHRQVSALPPALNRDRANAVRLAFENDGLRTENEELRRQNARLAVLVGECATKHQEQHREGNPS